MMLEQPLLFVQNEFSNMINVFSELMYFLMRGAYSGRTHLIILWVAVLIFSRLVAKLSRTKVA